MAGTKRQHHLAQGIQRNFLAKGATKLWWYSRVDNRYEERTTRGIGHARHTYTFTAVPGSERYAIEDALAKVEDLGIPALRKLEQRESITQAERNAIAELVGFQFIRTPSRISFLSEFLNVGSSQLVSKLADQLEAMTPEEFEANMRKKRDATGRAWDLDQRELVDGLRIRPPRVTATKEGTLEAMVELGTGLAVEFSKRTWVVLHAPKSSSFITSDQGVFMAPGPGVDPEVFGPATPGVAIVFPFATHAALLVTGKPPVAIEHARTDGRQVRSINDGLAQVSHEIYSHSRELLASVVKRNELDTTRYALEVDEASLAAVQSHLRQAAHD